MAGARSQKALKEKGSPNPADHVACGWHQVKTSRRPCVTLTVKVLIFYQPGYYRNLIGGTHDA